MMAHELVPHPDFPPSGIRRVAVRWHRTRHGQLLLRWLVEDAAALVAPEFAGKGRGDKLWETTCFELFLLDEAGQRYCEFNFSPSGRWALYGFTGWREGMVELEPIAHPEITADSGQSLYVMTATIDAGELAGARVASLAAVIDEMAGTRSYWALAHAPGKPDFHNPACFALPLATRQPA